MFESLHHHKNMQCDMIFIYYAGGHTGQKSAQKKFGKGTRFQELNFKLQRLLLLKRPGVKKVMYFFNPHQNWFYIVFLFKQKKLYIPQKICFQTVILLTKNLLYDLLYRGQ